MYTVRRLFADWGPALKLDLVGSKEGLDKKIPLADAYCAGLVLCGYTKQLRARRICVLGREEVSYLKELDEQLVNERLSLLFSAQPSALIIADRQTPPAALKRLCQHHQVCLFRTDLTTLAVLGVLYRALQVAFAPEMTCHGTFVEVFGSGVLIQGESAVGKSEAALGLVERGHRLVCDDVVKLKVSEGTRIEGSGPELSRHLMEIRGMGIINLSHLYGAVCVCDARLVDLIVQLEEWNDRRFYDRVGLDDATTTLLGIAVPSYVLPVKPGRDVVLLIETLVLNHRLKQRGYHSAQEFNRTLLEKLSGRKSGQTTKDRQS